MDNTSSVNLFEIRDEVKFEIWNWSLFEIYL